MGLFGCNAFNLLETVFPIIFLAVFAFLIYMGVKAISQWNKNNHSPRLTVPALVVSKRSSTSHSHHPVGGDVTGASGMYTSSSTSYYVTFQVESGDRMELSMRGSEYGMLAEGDVGMLSFQGTRYLGFERTTEK